MPKIEANELIILIMHSPREKVWGVLHEINGAGAFVRGIDLNSFEDYVRAIVHDEPFMGLNDQFFPLSVVRSTRDALNAGGFNPELIELKGHTHWYYDKAPEINRKAWDFLKMHELTSEPKYQQHQFR